MDRVKAKDGSSGETERRRKGGASTEKTVCV